MICLALMSVLVSLSPAVCSWRYLPCGFVMYDHKWTVAHAANTSSNVMLWPLSLDVWTVQKSHSGCSDRNQALCRACGMVCQDAHCVAMYTASPHTLGSHGHLHVSCVQRCHTSYQITTLLLLLDLVVDCVQRPSANSFSCHHFERVTDCHIPCHKAHMR